MRLVSGVYVLGVVVAVAIAVLFAFFGGWVMTVAFSIVAILFVEIGVEEYRFLKSLEGRKNERTDIDVLLPDIKNNPEKHIHTMEGLWRCCTIDGFVDKALMDAHCDIDLGTADTGVKCDMADGPCACGAWHSPREILERFKNRQK